MRHVNKIAATLMCAIYMFGLTGCTFGNTKEQKIQVMDSVSKIEESIKALDYESLSHYIYEDVDKLREQFKLGEGIDDDRTVEVRKAIASTIRTNAHEDTLEFTGYGKFATINVDLMVVDYEKFARDNKFQTDVESMKENVKNFDLLKSVNIYKIPMRFIFKNGRALWENPELLEQIFVFADYDEIVFADNLTTYLKDYTFVDSEDDTYTAPKKILLEVALDSKGQQFDWTYGYEVSYSGLPGNEEVIYESEDSVGHGAELIQINYSTGKTLKAGTYRITIKRDGQEKSYTCKVADKIEDPTEGGVFRCPDTNPYVIKTTGVKVDLPQGYFFVNGGSSLGNDLLNAFGNKTLEFIISDDDGDMSNEFMYCLSLYVPDYSGQGNNVTDDQLLDLLIEGRKDIYNRSNIKVSVKKKKISISGKDYRSADFKITEKGHSAYMRIIMLPDGSTFHAVIVFTQTEEAMKTYTSMLK